MFQQETQKFQQKDIITKYWCICLPKINFKITITTRVLADIHK